MYECKWNEDIDSADGSVMENFRDIVNYFNEQFENDVDKKLVEFKWEGDE